MSAIINVQNLSHRYGERIALDKISFQILQHGIFGFLGPNGGGKTTLFRILSTMLYPSVGLKDKTAIEIFGLNLFKEAHQIRERLGVIFQSPSLDKKLTVGENLAHQGHLYGLRGDELEKRIARLLHRVNLGERRKDRVEILSGGLKRRVEIAKALLHDPRLLLLDEPTTGLDPGARIEIWNYLKILKESGVTSCVTTHLMEEAEKCDILFILHQGKFVAQGAPTELKESIGGDVITIKTQNADKLKALILERFGAQTTVLPSDFNRIVRIGKKVDSGLVIKIKEAFLNEIESITLSKPSLEDVFINKTGDRFWESR